jgi:penicillin-binding protein 1A
MARYVIRVARRAGIVVLFVVAALLGILSGVLFAFAGDLPQISALDDYAPNTIARVLASNGEVIGEFATERRVIIGYDDISPLLRNAIIAAEDASFNQHFGLSIPRIIVTAVRDVVKVVRGQDIAGASTLTQQLARHIEVGGERLGLEKRLERKIREAILSIQIEKRYTKREILTLYCNQMYLGSGAYGVEAASRLYFGKSAKDLELAEAAVIAGVFQTPSRQSPLVNPDRARVRRNYVLERMAEEGYITRQEADAAKTQPIVLRASRTEDTSIAPYFVEEVRKDIEAKYGAKRLYESGLLIQTSLDVALQRAANLAVDDGLRRLDKRRGFRRPGRNVIAEGHDAERFEHARWQRAMREGDIVPAVVTRVSGTAADARVGRYLARLEKEAVAWTGRQPGQLLKPGDLIEVRLRSLQPDAGTVTVALEQTPIVEGALVAIDNATGQIRAMVGGYSFERSKFNRATQASRQLGSLFKAILYTAAIDRGYTPTAIISDEPVSFEAGPGQPMYEPHNYDGTFEGPVTLRHALEKSRNIPAVKVMEQLGPAQVVAYAKRFGFTTEFPPFLSSALGAGEATLVEVTSAYSVFPNQGIRMQPYQILRVTDRDGNVLEENRPSAHDTLRADTAFVMTSLLRGVVQRGTAARAATLDWPLGGKTGTVDDFTDAWFVGFAPDITIGVWVGHDEKKPLGNGEDGARAALPIWIDAIKTHIDARKAGQTEKVEFPAPGNIVFLTVDRHSGEVAEAGAANVISEAYISGTQPGVGFPR